MNFLSGTYIVKLCQHDGHHLFISFILNVIYRSLGNIEAQIGCLDLRNRNISLRKAFRLTQNMEKNRTIKFNMLGKEKSDNKI